jgi:hypothetical protein
MKNILTSILLLFSVLVFSQTIEKSSISSGGASTINGSVQMIYSIGEVNIAESTSGNIHISEGFISKKIDAAALGIINSSLIEGVTVFPNPTVDFVNLRFNEVINAQLRVFDISGKELLAKKFNDKNTKVDLRFFRSGIYLLHIYDVDNMRSITYKISKK